MKKNIVVLDILFYVAIPLLIWNVMREHIGDYYTMLLSSVPAILYTLYRFFVTKQFNVIGIYILATLVISTLIDVLAGSALQLLWNNVYYSISLSLFFLLTMLIKKPLALYFGLEWAEMQGYDRLYSKALYYKRPIFIVFQLITLAFALRSVVYALINTSLIMQYGVEAFDKGIVLKQVLSWVFTIITIFGFMYAGKLINNSPHLVEEVKREIEEQVQ
ncbi:hypothetical protein EJF36_02405 [Bacillus sp. HMF5848]|uniref:VC0807 family protein n=1 Tax=Bacillus sp. HMF5848 TaxID=2495421 RepID=UPI000F774116|nr:VC0807 family protein [Bacillus sp. HMF5848]RSK25832.1 hypothetical protein EJF36_02405 [Bacillus sp. HMF5848]